MGDVCACFSHQVWRIRGTYLTNVYQFQALWSTTFSFVMFDTPPHLEVLYFLELLIRIFEQIHKQQNWKCQVVIHVLNELHVAGDANQVGHQVSNLAMKVIKWVNWLCGEDETAWFFSSSFSSKAHVLSPLSSLKIGRLISDLLGGSLENAEKQSRLPESKGQYQWS